MNAVIKNEKSITAKARKNLECRFDKMSETMPAYHHHLDFRSMDDFTDNEFANAMRNVNGVNMLDLNETDITNDSITLLTYLEYVNELRAKQCRNLNDGCIAALNKLTSLTFLHVRYTDITIDGLLKLNNLTNLKTLMFSADDVADIEEKLLQLKTMLPQCEFVINGKPFQCNSIHFFMYSMKGKPIKYRLKIKNEAPSNAWSNWLSQPSESYIEAAAQGTFAIDDVEWLDINPIEIKEIGKLIAAQKIDHTNDIIQLFDFMQFPYMITDGIVSVYLVMGEI